MNVLTVDIGNSNTVLLMFENGEKGSCLRVKSNGKMMNELAEFLSNHEIDVAGISSVVPKLTLPVEKLIRDICKIEPVTVSRFINTGLDNSSIPAELGSDLICNLINAHITYPESYVTVADFGTAFTTVTVDPDGKFIGCTIAPGLGTAVRSLFSNTAQIPLLDVSFPDSVFGKTTTEAVSSGIYFGFCGQLDGIVKRIEKETGHEVQLVLTGGYSSVIRKRIEHSAVADPDFTMKGVFHACLLNS